MFLTIRLQHLREAPNCAPDGQKHALNRSPQGVGAEINFPGERLDFEILHSTELLQQLVEAGALPLHADDLVVTYHDPCDLGRNSGIYDAPRRVLQAIPGLTLMEMSLSHEDALCCGGGGNLEMVDSALVRDIGRRKLQLALDTGAQTVISACQQCTRTIAATARAEKTRLRVLDITELVWQASENGMG